jgi:hypothetical protein
MEFIESIRHRAFDDLDVRGYDVDLTGWMSTNSFTSLFSAALDRLHGPRQVRKHHPVIVEVGTWKGLSAATMARMCIDRGLKDARIVCVDTWLGSPEYYTQAGIKRQNMGASLKHVNGYPSVYFTFTKNMKKLKLDKAIAPLPLPSAQAYDVLKHHKVRADIVYIDAAHEYEAVLLDIRKYYELLNPGGTMIGDDYHKTWPGVIKAVKEFCFNHQLDAVVDGSVWSLRKPCRKKK